MKNIRDIFNELPGVQSTSMAEKIRAEAEKYRVKMVLDMKNRIV